MTLNNTLLTSKKGEGESFYTVPVQGDVVGVAPSVVLDDPKFAHNVGNTMRACSCWGIEQLWWTGKRVQIEIAEGNRIPREERMKGYKAVKLFAHDDPLSFFEDATPVIIELKPNTENLLDFEHPENAVYIFGPEDGSVSGRFLRRGHRFIQIPTHHCLNLAAAVNCVLFHRRLVRITDGRERKLLMSEYLNEQRGAI